MGKNSKLNKISKADTLKKENIKKSTENTGFLVQTTKIDEAKQKEENNINNLYVINIIY